MCIRRKDRFGRYCERGEYCISGKRFLHCGGNDDLYFDKINKKISINTYILVDKRKRRNQIV